ncbi:hypothetical protein EV175_000156 [Coemansia sp. RSA 1933]|nr:hypothetical protein EV175_000156 [Coemansia sp. RSA 1933]
MADDDKRKNKQVLDAPHRFVDVSSGILRTLTGDIGKQTQMITLEFAVSMDGLTNSTNTHMDSLAKLLQSTRDQLETTMGDVAANARLLRECTEATNALAIPSVRELAVEAEGALKSVADTDEAADQGHSQRVEQMDRRNEAFEQKLRKDHEEFSRAHARRLANVLQYQF